jgi:hypothetical protein
MKENTDEFIVLAYKKAVELQLDPVFIQLLENELERRGLNIDVTVAQRIDEGLMKSPDDATRTMTSIN